MPDTVAEWLRTLGRNEKRVITALKRVLAESVRTSMSLAEIERLYAAGNTAAIVEAIDWHVWQRSYAKYLTPELAETLRRGAEAGIKGLPTELQQAFFVIDPVVEAAIIDYGAQMIVQVTEAQKQAVNAYVLESYVNGTGPKAAARSIRDVVGVTEREGLAIARFEGKVDDVFRGERTAASLRRQYPTMSRSITGNAEKIKADYRRRTLLRRAERIARTETAHAYHRGQRAVWQDLKTRGVYTSEVLEWITVQDDRTCQICSPMQGQQISLELGFTTGSGMMVDVPPAHPGCRCDVRIVLDRQFIRPELLAVAGVA